MPECTQYVRMPLNNETIVICPHCKSGFVILTLGIKNHKPVKLAVCVLKEVKISFYCPYCGKDMTEIIRREDENKGGLDA